MTRRALKSPICSWLWRTGSASKTDYLYRKVRHKVFFFDLQNGRRRASLNIEDLLTGFSVESVTPDISESAAEVPHTESAAIPENTTARPANVTVVREIAESDAREKKRLFAAKHGLDSPLLSGMKITKIEVFLMILHLVVRHSNTDALTLDLIAFVKALLGENVLNPSLHVFTKLFSSEIQRKFHFFVLNVSHT